MFQTIQAQEIFDIPKEHRDDVNKAMSSESRLAYWLAQLRKADWLYLLRFINVHLPAKTQKQFMAEVALQHLEFVICEGRGEVWQTWTEARHETQRVLVIQLRHSEANWSRGLPEFVDLEKNEPLGFVNIAARLICKVK